MEIFFLLLTISILCLFNFSKIEIRFVLCDIFYIYTTINRYKEGLLPLFEQIGEGYKKFRECDLSRLVSKIDNNFIKAMFDHII